MLAPHEVIVLTPPGRGAVASVRVEGPRAAEIVGRPFHSIRGTPLESFPVGRVVFGRWASPDGEEVVVCRQGRESEAVEIHCHGGQIAVRAVVDSLVELGCIERNWVDWAESHAGDRIAAEAGVGLSEARTTRTAAILLDQWHGALRREVGSLEALLPARDEEALQTVDDLLKQSTLGLHLTQPWRVVLAGRPNVGKSSLINAVLGYERAIVFDQPGTTRDAVTAAAALEGWPVELADTAGLREEAEALEAEGIAITRRRLAAADLVVLVCDASREFSEEDAGLFDRWPQALLVHNKCDLTRPDDDRPEGLSTSALTGEGLKELVRRMAQRLVPHVPSPGAGVPFTRRQVDLLRQARAALAEGELDACGGHLRAIREQ